MADTAFQRNPRVMPILILFFLSTYYSRSIFSCVCVCVRERFRFQASNYLFALCVGVKGGRMSSPYPWLRSTLGSG